MMGGDCSDKENAQVTDRENNNEAPREIRIVKSELNDSFEPEEPEERKTSTKVKQRTFKRNFSPVQSNLFSPWRKVKDGPVIKAPNSHIRFDEVGEPILDLRPLGVFRSTESLGGFTTVKSKSQSKRKKNQFRGSNNKFEGSNIPSQLTDSFMRMGMFVATLEDSLMNMCMH